MRLLLLLLFFLRQAGAAGEIAGSVKRENSPAGKQEKSVEPGIASAVREFRYTESSKSGYADILLWNEARARVIESGMHEKPGEYVDDAPGAVPVPVPESEKSADKNRSGFLNRYLYDGASDLYRHAGRREVEKPKAKKVEVVNEKKYRERRRELMGSMVRVVRNSPEHIRLKKELDNLDRQYGSNA